MIPLTSLRVILTLETIILRLKEFISKQISEYINCEERIQFHSNYYILKVYIYYITELTQLCQLVFGHLHDALIILVFIIQCYIMNAWRDRTGPEGSSKFPNLYHWCEITLPQRQLPPILSAKSYHSCQREPDLITLPCRRWVKWSWTFFPLAVCASQCFQMGLYKSTSHSWSLNENQFLPSHPHTQ